MNAESDDRRQSGIQRSAPPLSKEGQFLLEAIADRAAAHLRRVNCTEIDARRATIDAYFKLGDDIHTLRTTAAFGARLMSLLAARINFDESRLQKIGRMAERIGAEERQILCDLVDSKGLPLTPSHFIELERVQHTRERMRLVSEALETRLSVRLFRMRIDALLAKTG